MRKAKAFAGLWVAAMGGTLSLERDAAEVIELSSGGRVISIPANPDTIQGFTGDVYLDEFALHQDAEAIWSALFPSISKSRDLRLSVFSRPAGQSGKFYALWKSPASAGWSKHRVDIHQAVVNGCEHDIAELRAGMHDETAFASNYLCEFVDEAYALLSYDLLASCVNDELAYELDGEDLDKCVDLFGGMDIGRKHDLTVIYLIERVGVHHITRGVIELRNTRFAGQMAALDRVMGIRNLRRMCIDQTGLGMQLAEAAEDKYGHRIEPITFTPGVKTELAGLTKRVFEQGHVEIPDERRLIDDLHSVRKVVTTAGNERYEAPRDAGGHADRYWALALALHAADRPSRGWVMA